MIVSLARFLVNNPEHVSKTLTVSVAQYIINNQHHYLVNEIKDAKRHQWTIKRDTLQAECPPPKFPIVIDFDSDFVISDDLKSFLKNGTLPVNDQKKTSLLWAFIGIHCHSVCHYQALRSNKPPKEYWSGENLSCLLLILNSVTTPLELNLSLPQDNRGEKGEPHYPSIIPFLCEVLCNHYAGHALTFKGIDRDDSYQSLIPITKLLKDNPNLTSISFIDCPAFSFREKGNLIHDCHYAMAHNLSITEFTFKNPTIFFQVLLLIPLQYNRALKTINLTIKDDNLRGLPLQKALKIKALTSLNLRGSNLDPDQQQLR